MTEEQIEFYCRGYDECSAVVRRDLSAILDLEEGRLDEIRLLLDKLRVASEESNWRRIQKESPGISREQYEAELEADCEAIKKEFYSEKGHLKPRLVRQPNF